MPFSTVEKNTEKLVGLSSEEINKEIDKILARSK